jgi:DNA-binding MarR family transcriptional regulator
MNPRQKSEIRFKHVNHLCDEVLRNLEPSQALVLLIGWRHADTRSVFRLSAGRIADYTGLSIRQVKRILDSLVKVGAIVILEQGGGTQSNKYRITGHPKG